MESIIMRVCVAKCSAWNMWNVVLSHPSNKQSLLMAVVATGCQET